MERRSPASPAEVVLNCPLLGLTTLCQSAYRYPPFFNSVGAARNSGRNHRNREIVVSDTRKSEKFGGKYVFSAEFEKEKAQIIHQWKTWIWAKPIKPKKSMFWKIHRLQPWRFLVTQPFFLFHPHRRTDADFPTSGPAWSLLNYPLFIPPKRKPYVLTDIPFDNAPVDLYSVPLELEIIPLVLMMGNHPRRWRKFPSLC